MFTPAAQASVGFIWIFAMSPKGLEAGGAGWRASAFFAPHTPAVTADRYVCVDGLRFFAALAIVFVHCDMLVAGYGWAESRIWLPTFNLCVDFFFILSGFVIETTYSGRMKGVRDYERFMRARFARIYPMHALTLAVCVSLGFLTADGAHFRVAADWLKPEFLPSNLLLTHAFHGADRGSFNLASWSLSAEMAMYLTFPITLALLRVLRPAGVVALAVCFFAATSYLRDQPWTLATHGFGIVRAVPAFLVGAAISVAIRGLHAPGIGFAAVAAIVGCVGYLMFSAAHPTLILALLPFCVAFPVIAERNANFVVRGRRVMAFLGDLSYSVYMLHMPLLYVVTDWLDHSGFARGQREALVFAVVPAATVALAWPMFRWFEAPMRSLINGRRTSVASTASPAAARPPRDRATISDGA